VRRHGIPRSGHPWNSFPSGHAVHLGAIAAPAARLAPERLRPLVWAAAGALAMTRLMLLAHYATDVIAGFAIGSMLDRIVRQLLRCPDAPPRSAAQRDQAGRIRAAAEPRQFSSNGVAESSAAL
jgi:PAP2 superfamily